MTERLVLIEHEKKESNQIRIQDIMCRKQETENTAPLSLKPDQPSADKTPRDKISHNALTKLPYP